MTEDIVAIGHRVVHGGSQHVSSEPVTQELIADLGRLSPLDPDHLPDAVVRLEVFRRRFPRLPQVACFDTAFHHDMPRVARLLAIPRRYKAEGVRRYGFHGLSYTYLMEELGRTAGAAAAAGRLILAHLGSGASLAAVRDGKCVDTTMALTPASGLVMSTRTGDIDPGLLVYFMRSGRMTVDQIDDMVNHRSGLLGVSETSGDMRDLLAREAHDTRAAEAVALFCYQASKWLGAFTAALGGLETLVFTGGIGENAPPVRARICEALAFLGIRLDEGRNAVNAPIISTDATHVTVRVIPTDEEQIIARETQRVLDPRILEPSG